MQHDMTCSQGHVLCSGRDCETCRAIETRMLLMARREYYEALSILPSHVQKHASVRRFNLLREESEGFAKLLEALLRFEKAAMDALHIKLLVRRLMFCVCCERCAC